MLADDVAELVHFLRCCGQGSGGRGCRWVWGLTCAWQLLRWPMTWWGWGISQGAVDKDEVGVGIVGVWGLTWPPNLLCWPMTWWGLVITFIHQ